MEIEQKFVADIKGLLIAGRQKAYNTINFIMVETYWSIGKRIVEEEQNGNEKADYGSFLIKELSKQLSGEFGKGFSQANLRNFRQFYQTFPSREIHYAVRSESEEKIKHALPSVLRKELTWTHYRLLMRVENVSARQYYLNEAANQNWSTRVLERNINTFYYERLLSSQNKQEVLKQSGELEKQSPADFIKDPYIFEFLNIAQPSSPNEQQIETALINNLQQFLLELGKGFSFVGRQFRISTETSHFFIDLVFYNYILKCFVLFDLKTGKLTHQDTGQMDMYIRMFDDLKRTEGDNPTIGIILCSEKEETVVKYSILNGNEQLFATKYRLYLPTEEELVAEIEREKLLIAEQLQIQNGEQ
jgi:predicted nuclease of restriction endonuclease-like (RecB) superfamily